MREILFRGQTRRKGEKVRMGDGKPIDSNWVYGGVFPQNKGGDFAIIYTHEPIDKRIVYADTVCEYVGIEDKNKTKVFEWDIVRCIYNGKLFIGVVVWNEDDLGFEVSNMKNGTDREFQYLGCCEEIEIIGNIFDNPDLLTTSSTDSDWEGAGVKENVNAEKLINRFENMARRGTLLTGRNDISQEDLLIQIIGTILKVAMEEE